MAFKLNITKYIPLKTNYDVVQIVYGALAFDFDNDDEFGRKKKKEKGRL